MNLAINGFGRIGRTAFRAILQAKAQKKIQNALSSEILNKEVNKIDKIVINSLDTSEMIEYLIKHDSNYGTLDIPIKKTSDSQFSILDLDIEIVSNRDPEKLPWKEKQIDIVLECTGIFTEHEKAQKHLKAGAKKVIISAPSKSPEIPTILIGVNEEKKQDSSIICMGSCTTNCAAVVIEVIHRHLGVEKSFLNTAHAYTSTQSLVDNNQENKKRRSRAAAANFVPTTTGAAIAVTKALPELKDRFDGLAIRVPTAIVSLADLVILTKKETAPQQVNEIFNQEKKTPRYLHIIDTNEEELASSDYIGNPFSAIIDTKLTQVNSKNLVRVIAWYDNEWAYANRLVELACKA